MTAEFALAAKAFGTPNPDPSTKVVHVCGEKMDLSTDGSGRYVCTRCLQSGYLVPTN